MVKTIRLRLRTTMTDWHVAWNWMRPARASPAPASNPTPIPISSSRVMSAARGAAVPRKPVSCTPSPQSSPGRYAEHSREERPIWMEAALDLVPKDLVREVYPAEESTEVPGQSHKCNPDRFDGQAETGQNSSELAERS